MSRWPLVPLGEVLTQRSGRIALEPDETYAQVTARLWGKGLVLRGRVKGSEIAADQQVRVETGQFLISKIDARHGAFGIVPSELDGAVVSNDFPVFDVIGSRALPAYISWVSRTNWFVALCRGASEGSTNRVRLKEARFLTQEIPLPPLEDQRHIVERLDAAAAWVDVARAKIEEIDGDLLQAARIIVRGSADIGESVRKIGSFMKLRSQDVEVRAEVEYDFAGVFSFGRGVFRSGLKSGATFAYKTLTRLSAGNFVYPKLMAWEGALGVVPPDCDGLVVSPEFPVFEIDTSIVRPEVVDVFFRDPSCLPMLRSASSGTNMRRRRIQPSRFLEFRMPVPSKARQAQVADLLDRRAVVLARHQVSLRELDQILPALMHEAFDT